MVPSYLHVWFNQCHLRFTNRNCFSLSFIILSTKLAVNEKSLLLLTQGRSCCKCWRDRTDYFCWYWWVYKLFACLPYLWTLILMLLQFFSPVCVLIHVFCRLGLVRWVKLLVWHQEGHLACKKFEWWGAGMVICLEWGADDLHMDSWWHYHPIISCFSKTQSGLLFC